MKQATIVWEVQKALFEFDSVEDLNGWVNSGGKTGFAFYLGNADDSEDLFGEVDDEEIVNVVLNPDQYVYTVEEDTTVLLNASVSFNVNLLDGVTVEDFEEWVEEGSGWSCGSVFLVDSEVEELSSWDDGDITLVM